MLRTMILAAMCLLSVPMDEARGQGSDPVPEHSDGTLPLKLPSDGTLPLKLTGTTTAAGGGANLPILVTITSAETKALPPGAAGQVRCQLVDDHVSRHRATGTVTVGNDLYTVRGICYLDETRQMEVVASRNGGQESFLVGALEEVTPSKFSGRMTITGGQPAAARYVFSTHRVGELHPPQ